MKVSIELEDLGTLCICAIRYCHGRQTYMPTLVQGIVRGFLGKFSDKDLDVMIQDCQWQRQLNLYGDQVIDKPSWLKYQKDLLGEKERRSAKKIRVH